MANTGMHHNNTNIGGSGIDVTWSGGDPGAGWQGTTINGPGSGWTLTFTYTGPDDKVISSIVINGQYISGSGLSSGWALDVTTLTWSGTPSKTVTMSGKNLNVYFNSSSSVVITLSYMLTAHSDGEATPNYWATYYNGTTSYTADANTTVYQAAVNAAKTGVTLTEVASREIPASQGVVLKSSASSITLTPVTSTSADFSGNELLGYDAATQAPANAYCLSRETSGSARGVGFYSYNLIIPAHRAYLVVADGPTNAREFLGFGGNDNATGIALPEAEVTEGDSPVYDLSGRRVTGQPQKGIYVKNGKKFVIK